MALKDGDFVEISYTAKLEDGTVFDTTDDQVAKDNNFHNPQRSYGPVIVSLGKTQVIVGLDEALVGKELQAKFTVTLGPEKAFGKKDAKLIQLVPLSNFRKQNIDPQPGMQLNIDGSLAKILRASGGRVLVDFNHPFAGKTVTYEVQIGRQVTDLGEQAASVLNMQLGRKDIKATAEGDKVTLSLPENIQNNLNDQVKEVFSRAIKEMIPSVKEVGFSKK